MTTLATSISRSTPPKPSDQRRQRLFSLDEFIDMFERGMFKRQRVELLNGKIIEMPSQSEPHVTAITKTRKALEAAFGANYNVRTEGTLRLSNSNAPDPDLSVVEGEPDDWAGRGNPTSALLVVEVSNTSLAEDRGEMARIYAGAGICDYWIVNVVDRQLEIFREPVPDATSESGASYSSRQIVLMGGSIAPLARSDRPVAVNDLLPRAGGTGM